MKGLSVTEPGKLEAISLEKAEEILEEFEAPTRKYKGIIGYISTGLAVFCSLFALYGAFGSMITQVSRFTHVMLILMLTFLFYPPFRSWKDRGIGADIFFALLTFTVFAYPFLDFEAFIYRVANPLPMDVLLGVAACILVLEATRRSTGTALPVLVLICVAYAYWGSYLPEPWGHRGYNITRIIALEFMTLNGLFGTPVEVSSTFIILFTIFGAVLEISGAGKFFVDFALGCMGKSRAGAGRAVTLASFLLGTVSGSGAATTVTLGAVAWPLLKRSGYDKESAGGLLAAGGIGAILSPPVLGAASFLIAEILKISYLEVLIMASIPTILYYASILFMVEGDARHFHLQQVTLNKIDVLMLTRQYWFHFTSLVTIVIFMALGFTAITAVFYSILIAIVTSFFNKNSALFPRKLIAALAAGSKQVLGVASTCACAGIIVGIINLTGMGLKFSGIIVDLAGGNLYLTLVLTAIILLILGLALPITASYIIAAVMTAPALIKLGVPEVAAHMFIFYYAVLSEVSPPTALSPFAAAAITGGNPFKTTMLAWKYTLPAFIVPFMFTASPEGIGLLLKGPIVNIILVTITALGGVWALSGAAGGYLVRPIGAFERAALAVSGILLFYAGTIQDVVGAFILGSIILKQILRRRSEVKSFAIYPKV
ncbi:MAG TPA: TRAP transporter fused permease subunit [Thermodesulfobacteriota bacterium]|nr:TRAP transporter fused permease subunit [Thermodesulfobacteriota bacterium]